MAITHQSLRPLLLFLSYLVLPVIAEHCKCLPGDPCWPDETAWARLNATVSGALIQNRPIAAVCYPGMPEFDGPACERLTADLMTAEHHLNSPSGYQYPLDVPCPVRPSSNGTCSLGVTPVYTINATHYEHVSAGVRFAQTHGLRLVIRNTGHDLLGRSTGFGALQIWIRHLRTGIHFADSYVPTKPCPGHTQWDGASVTIGGGYEWGEAYQVVSAKNKLIVGGGTPTVGCIGGWMQGGGHSPASHEYSLGADQILEAKVVLADGNLVTANACHNPSLFRAIRGGSPAYGVVVSATWKVYPTRNVTAQSLTFAAKTSKENDVTTFFTALTNLYTESVYLIDHGAINGAYVYPAYTHVLTGLGKTRAQTNKVMQRLMDKLPSDDLHVSTKIDEFPTYGAYLSGSAFTNSSQAASILMAYGSRLLDKRALAENRDALKRTIHKIAGNANQMVMNALLFVGAGEVFVDRSDTAILPAWRSTYVHALVSRMWAPETPSHEVEAIQKDITYEKVGALRKLAPATGAYMNEADRLDPNWVEDFYGWRRYEELSRIKHLYDPDDLFYCPTCVGATRWREAETGALCRV
ncbi:hypothetical protein BDV59DRAFT_192561 [Aspergillus ambiguus]|uniref:uncharacterized protein n=1 Tax=Aspergillus ambiguus TaxID=176160 RepID=UPI003CCCD1C1